ncbi:peroxidase-like [Copidosoma floridanum]|uniref:peroxidase-like n=1 Tax=Copidosoma floridanum TaxID=29053 RepID=UPI0006C97F66|nr:peroxidase-like [Copidosoma floridanum]
MARLDSRCLTIIALAIASAVKSSSNGTLGHRGHQKIGNERSGRETTLEGMAGPRASYPEPREEDLIEAADFGIRAMNELYDLKEPRLYKMGLYLRPDNPARFVAAFNDQSEEARQLARFGYAALEASTKFRSKFPDLLRQASFDRAANRSPLRQQCPKKGIPQCPPASLRYRTTDGSCNNLKELWWGSAMSPMQRFLPGVYDDGIQSVRRSVTGAELPSARQISDRVHEERDVPLTSVTHMLMQWGQFIDHDVTATGQSTAFNGSIPQCCLNGGVGVQPPEFLHPECLPISVEPRDSRLGKLGVRCMEFVRSGAVPREDCEFGTREQLSQVTSYIDASTVYSSSARQGDTLRVFRGGLMQYGKLQPQRPFLPKEEEESDLCRRGSLSTNCFRAGDIRLSEQPALISLHVVFLRLHNSLAARMAGLNQHWGDEKVFQETRRIVGAIVQHVTYREFLPIVLGHDVMKLFDIELRPRGYYDGYDETVSPNVANEFSAAAFRFGHSLVQPSFVRFDANHRPIPNNVSIHEEFRNPGNLESPGSVDRLLLGLVNQPAQRRDEFISEELTGHLFQTPGFPFGMDLASINVQRGRDHGIPAFADYRLPCGLSPVRDWTDLERVLTPRSAGKLRDLYAAVEDVDLFTAGLAEKPVAGGLVGPTFACIIAQQFRNLRKGDRFWYENPFLENGFTPAQLQQIRKVTLAQVLCSTMHNIDDIQVFVMLAADNFRNQRLSCTDPAMGRIDLTPWTEKPRRRRSAEEEEEVEARGAKKKQSPMKTRISQHNRIAVRRPLGPRENITIVVNNNAVNAPVIVTDSVYGSSVHVNRFPAGPYFPHNFQDPDNPNPPSYGLSPKPLNDHVPNNEFFAQLDPHQRYSYLSTPTPRSPLATRTPRPVTRVTTRRSPHTDRDEDQTRGTGLYGHPTKKGTSNRRYSDTGAHKKPTSSERPGQGASTHYLVSVVVGGGSTSGYPVRKSSPKPSSPNNGHVAGSTSGYSTIGRPSATTKPVTSQTQNYNFHAGAVPEVNGNGDQEGGDLLRKPVYLHTHTTISDVKYVESGLPQRHQVTFDPELPRPIFFLQNRAASGGTLVVDKETELTTDRVNEYLAQTTSSSDVVEENTAGLGHSELLQAKPRTNLLF